MFGVFFGGNAETGNTETGNTETDGTFRAGVPDYSAQGL